MSPYMVDTSHNFDSIKNYSENLLLGYRVKRRIKCGRHKSSVCGKFGRAYFLCTKVVEVRIYSTLIAIHNANL